MQQIAEIFICFSERIVKQIRNSETNDWIKMCESEYVNAFALLHADSTRMIIYGIYLGADCIKCVIEKRNISAFRFAER